MSSRLAAFSPRPSTSVFFVVWCRSKNDSDSGCAFLVAIVHICHLQCTSINFERRSVHKKQNLEHLCSNAHSGVVHLRGQKATCPDPLALHMLSHHFYSTDTHLICHWGHSKWWAVNQNNGQRSGAVGDIFTTSHHRINTMKVLL